MPAKMKRWRLNNFTAGIDRTDGRVTDQQNRFYELTNYRINNIKSIVRRPPNRKPGAITSCQGLIPHRGTLYTVAKRGDTPVFPSIPGGQTISTVYFDVPPGCGSTWTLLELFIFKGDVAALIQHDFNGDALTERFFLHVFDAKENKPTYAEDMAVPTQWTPQLPQHFVGKGIIGSAFPYRPRMTVANGRIWVSRPDGDVGFSATSKARIWNELTVDDLTENGESWHYFIPDSGGPSFTFLTSLAHADVAFYYGLIVEYLDSTGIWVPMPQVGSTPTDDKTWTYSAVSAPWATSDRVQINLYWTGAADSQIRVRSVLFGTTPIILVQPAPVLSVDNWGTFTVGTAGSWSGNTAGNIEAFNNPAATGQALATSFHLLQFFTSVTPTLKTFYYGHGNSSVEIVGFPSFEQRKNGTYIAESLPTGTLGKQVKILHSVTVTGSTFQTASAATFGGGETTIDLDQPVAIGDYLLILNGSGNFERYRSASNGSIGVILKDNANAAGNFTAALGINRQVYNLGAGVTISDYTYPADTGAGNDFYLAQVTRFQIETAGAEDAGVIPTSAQPSSGGSIVTVLSSLKDRLLVGYKSGAELWLIPPDVNQHMLIDSGAIGTGEQVLAWPSLVDGVVILAMAKGMRGQGLYGQQLQSLRDQNLGEPIFALGYPQQNGATYWPYLGCFLTAVTIEGVVQFLALDLSPEEKIRAWGRWTVATLPEVEENSMAVLERRMYFRAGGSLYYFDDADMMFRDDTDPVGEDAYESFARWHFNDLKEPFRRKHVCLMEAAHIGRGYMELFQDAKRLDQGNGEVLMPDTLNSRSVPGVAVGHAIAVTMRSVDETGHTIEEIGLHYRLLGRG